MLPVKSPQSQLLRDAHLRVHPCHRLQALLLQICRVIHPHLQVCPVHHLPPHPNQLCHQHSTSPVPVLHRRLFHHRLLLHHQQNLRLPGQHSRIQLLLQLHLHRAQTVHHLPSHPNHQRSQLHL